MPSRPEHPLAFAPPGPGAWSLDTAHFPRPATHFVIEVFGDAARRGFQEATARYGLLLDHIAWGFVHRWAYLCPRPVPALTEAGAGLARRDWDRLVDATPALATRLATSARVFTDRPWREDVRVWDEHTKPRLRRGHLALQAAAPSGGHAGELATHVDRCRDNLVGSVYHHHRLNVAPVVPAGDFLVHAAEWTGRPHGELVALVRGDGPLAVGAAPQLARLAEALREDPAAAAALAGGPPPERVLAALTARPPPVGPATSDYLVLVGGWSVGSGSDVGEPCLREMPQLLVETIRAARSGRVRSEPSEELADRLSGVRAAVPRSRREAFDGLLAEARATHRVRDERATYCDVWAYGLARRAILAAGSRLADAGVIAQPEHLVEAGRQEIRSLLAGTAGLSGDELAARAHYREHASEAGVPTVLGDPPRRPIPVEWLPAGADRTERAFRAYVRAMSEEAAPVEARAPAASVHGLGASPGTATGRARVIRSAAELDRIARGDVLVTSSTTPAFNAVLPLVGAIVTDRGGLLSHAAIVARELAIPAVVGTREATRRIPDGALVVVDGTAGAVAVRD
ncbi:MAG TPA: PEP-utilizing enzyme [Egibacteraceae bacterium]|nr:PEP-utilizing enzyme [Egibacteraceae bacterium]